MIRERPKTFVDRLDAIRVGGKIDVTGMKLGTICSATHRLQKLTGKKFARRTLPNGKMTLWRTE